MAKKIRKSKKVLSKKKISRKRKKILTFLPSRKKTTIRAKLAFSKGRALKTKKLKKRKVTKRFKKTAKKPRKVLLKRKIKPLKQTKRAKFKKPSVKLIKASKPAKMPIKKVKLVERIKPQEPDFKLIKIPIELRKPKIKPKIRPKKRAEKRPPIRLSKRAKTVEPLIYKTKIKVIGIGGGGSSIISEIAPKIKKVNFLAANTDLQALKEVDKRASHFQFGQRLTQGLGTGMNPELGEQAAQDAREKIKKSLEGQNLCVLVSCLGGGTGSGASPVFAKASKRLGNVTFGIFTLPFEFEGETKMEVAQASLEKLKPNLNALILIPNQRIFQIIDTKTPLKEAFSTINKTLAQSLEGLIELIYSPGLINIDFADFKTILAGKEKLTFLNTIEAKASNEVEEVAKKVLSNPLYSYSVQGAKGILYNISGGENLSLDEIKQIGSIISNSVNPRAKVIFGITQNEKYKNKIKITLLATGCRGEKKEKPLEKPKGLKTPKPKRKIKKIKVSEKPKESPQAPIPPPPSTEGIEIETFSTTPLPPHLKKPEFEEEMKKLEKGLRRNTLDLKEAAQEEEKKMLARERKFETPAFLRRKSGQFKEEFGK